MVYAKGECRPLYRLKSFLDPISPLSDTSANTYRDNQYRSSFTCLTTKELLLVLLQKADNVQVSPFLDHIFQK